MNPVEPVSGGVRLALHVQPRASRTELAGMHGGALKLRLAAPPVDGAANLELLRFLAELLGVPRSRLVLRSGAAARRKQVLVQGISVGFAERRLGLPLTAAPE
jgi:uncharacterized protein (TIGR00251 family)